MMPVPLPPAGLAHKPSVLLRGSCSSGDHHLESFPTMKLGMAPIYYSLELAGECTEYFIYYLRDNKEK